MRTRRIRWTGNFTKKFSDCVKPDDVPIGTVSSTPSELAFLEVGQLKSTSAGSYIPFKGTWFKDVHVAGIAQRLGEAMCELGC